jgi:hypothetical protein
VCTFPSLEMELWGCGVCRGSFLLGELLLQPSGSTVGRNKQCEKDVKDLSFSHCRLGVGAMGERPTSPPSSNLGVENESTSDLSHWPLVASSPLLGSKNDNGGKVLTSMMSGNDWDGGPDSLISISGQLLVIDGML